MGEEKYWKKNTKNDILYLVTILLSIQNILYYTNKQNKKTEADIYKPHKKNKKKQNSHNF